MMVRNVYEIKITMKTLEFKKSKNIFEKKIFSIVALFIFFLALPQLVSAHCDSYDGPVIKDALKALKEKKVGLVLKWVEPKYEKEITAKFTQTLKLTGPNEEVNKVLETYFLETLVRLHREGEGEPYTGLKRAGSMTRMIKMADTALEKKDIESLVKGVNTHLEKVLREKYSQVIALSKTKEESVEMGRAYVAAYVEYTHTLEGLEHMLEGTGGHLEGGGVVSHSGL
jgi:hypothetical protein